MHAKLQMQAVEDRRQQLAERQPKLPGSASALPPIQDEALHSFTPHQDGGPEPANGVSSAPKFHAGTFEQETNILEGEGEGVSNNLSSERRREPHATTNALIQQLELENKGLHRENEG